MRAPYAWVEAPTGDTVRLEYKPNWPLVADVAVPTTLDTEPSAASFAVPVTIARPVALNAIALAPVVTFKAEPVVKPVALIATTPVAVVAEFAVNVAMLPVVVSVPDEDTFKAVPVVRPLPWMLVIVPAAVAFAVTFRSPVFEVLV